MNNISRKKFLQWVALGTVSFFIPGRIFSSQSKPGLILTNKDSLESMVEYGLEQFNSGYT